MKYIVCKRFKGKALCGEINLPAMTQCNSDGTLITYNGQPICYIGCENAHQYFALDDDGMGMERGRLTQAIQKALAKRDDNYQERWDKVWDDEVCQKYKRDNQADHWLWNNDFFNADIESLCRIAKLVGATKPIALSHSSNRPQATSSLDSKPTQ